MNISDNFSVVSYLLQQCEPYRSSNETVLESSVKDNAYFNAIATGYLSVLSPAIIFGNALTIVVLLQGKLKHKETCYFLLSLAVSDICIGLFTVPSYTFWIQSKFHHLSKPHCMMIIGSSLFLTVASILNLLLVSLERYLAICHVFFHLKLWKKRPFLIFVIGTVWVVSMIATASFMMTVNWDFKQCAYYEIFDEKLLTIAISVGIFLPGVMMAYMYIQIFRKTKKHLGTLYQSSITSSGVPTGKQRRNTASRAYNMVKTLVLVLLCYIVCWVPFLFAVFLWSICPWCSLPEIGNEVILLLGFTNSFLNPVVYCLRHESFRRSMKALVCTCMNTRRNTKRAKSLSL